MKATSREGDVGGLCCCLELLMKIGSSFRFKKSRIRFINTFSSFIGFEVKGLACCRWIWRYVLSV